MTMRHIDSPLGISFAQCIKCMAYGFHDGGDQRDAERKAAKKLSPENDP